MSILEGELAAEVADALGEVFYAATITRMMPGSGPAHNPGVPIACAYACKGIVDDYSTDLIDGTLIRSNDRKVLILAPTIEKAAEQPNSCTAATITPQPGDAVTIRGETGSIIRVAADPALATYELQARF